MTRLTGVLRMRRVCLAGLAGLTLLAPTRGAAQVPAGAEFRVNTYTTGKQGFLTPVIGENARGEFVVAWFSADQGGANADVLAQRYDSAGAPRGGEFQVNTTTFGFQEPSAVALDRDGDFVVVWDDHGAVVFAQLFASDGSRRGGEFQVSTYAAGIQYGAAAAMRPSGDFVVAWTSYRQDGHGTEVFGRRFGSAGQPLGPEFLVNTYTTGHQLEPSVAMAPDGRFAVVWKAYPQNGSDTGVYGQRFDAAGNRLGGEFRVHTNTLEPNQDAKVTMASDGSFVVAWLVLDFNNLAVAARRYDPAGNSPGAMTLTPLLRTAGPGLAGDLRGNFVVSWVSYYGSEDSSGRRFGADNQPRGPEFRANTYTTMSQRGSAVGSDAVGNFVVAWISYGQDGDDNGVFAQRFGGLQPAALAVDTSGNGVLEPGETTDMRPAWRNVTGAARTFTATLTASDPLYAITDGSASYGTVANGATAACGGDCFAISVSDPPTRPSLHWDAVPVESIVPDAQGQQKQWALHVGESFTDVPRSSTFYYFVETLLHHAVTAGCGGTAYCPLESATRQQMAVFVLAAKEGVGYAPPTCTTPVFDDVPASSPFCRWIEELARRGVSSGCGGGNYCPTAAVSREQMAVFVLRTLDPTLNPPACIAGSEMFADVPASSGFCRWIEELARRGITAGCGGGNYCPAQPVTREQMSVFLTGTFGLTLYGP